MRQSLIVKAAKLLDRCIGVGRWLKVRCKVFALVSSLQSTDTIVDLIANILFRNSPTRTEAAIVTEVTPPLSYGSIHVGAGKTSVDADLLHSMPELLL
jgi:hypothetical protein